MPTTTDHVGIVDDDAGVRDTVAMMLTHLGVQVHAYADVNEYLVDERARSLISCLVLDVRMPGISGLELQRRLAAQQRPPAIVFITGHADVSMAVDAMRLGAVDFLQKPFREQELLESVQRALRSKRKGRAAEEQSALVLERISMLTPRERDVLGRLLRGMRAKEIASELGISTKTAEEHRGHVMHKMQAASSGALIAMCTGVSQALRTSGGTTPE